MNCTSSSLATPTLVTTVEGHAMNCSSDETRRIVLTRDGASRNVGKTRPRLPPQLARRRRRSRDAAEHPGKEEAAS